MTAVGTALADQLTPGITAACKQTFHVDRSLIGVGLTHLPNTTTKTLLHSTRHARCCCLLLLRAHFIVTEGAGGGGGGGRRRMQASSAELPDIFQMQQP